MSATKATLFQPEALLAGVERQLGQSGLFSRHVTDALEVICRSAASDANLHAFGRFRIKSLLQDTLIQRGRLEQHFRAHPELAQQALVPPIFVTGMFRSGTTFLHRLLASAEDARPLALGELLTPFPAPNSLLPEHTKAALKFAIFKRTASPEIDAMHYMQLDLPEECVLGLRLDLRAWVFWRSAPLFSYLDWLMQQDMVPSYRLYQRLLQYFQAASPGLRLTLKAPMHLLALPALLEVFPQALVVQTHRDPLACVPSDHKLLFGFHGGVTAGVDQQRVIQTNTRGLIALTERSVAARQSAAGARIVDVDYHDLVRDPMATAKAIYRQFGLPFTPSHEQRIAAYLQQNQQFKHGQNPYRIEQFGQTKAELEQYFKAYRQHFLSH